LSAFQTHHQLFGSASACSTSRRMASARVGASS
jgi:hypothetical protein